MAYTTGGINLRVYTAILTQEGTANPTAVILANGISDEITWVRVSAGRYRATGPANTFPEGKTIGGCITGSGDFIYGDYWDNNEFEISVRNTAGTFVDDGLSETAIEIRVYS